MMGGLFLTALYAIFLTGLAFCGPPLWFMFCATAFCLVCVAFLTIATWDW